MLSCLQKVASKSAAIWSSSSCWLLSNGSRDHRTIDSGRRQFCRQRLDLSRYQNDSFKFFGNTWPLAPCARLDLWPIDAFYPAHQKFVTNQTRAWPECLESQIRMLLVFAYWSSQALAVSVTFFCLLSSLDLQLAHEAYCFAFLSNFSPCSSCSDLKCHFLCFDYPETDLLMLSQKLHWLF